MAKKTKTKPDATRASALMVAKEYPAVAPVVERIFKRICPTLDLIDFNALRADGWRNIRDQNWILLSGSESELIGLGIVEAAMIPVRPKRLAWSDHVQVRRLAGDRLSVHIDLGESLGRARLLAPLASWNWQTLVDQIEPTARIRGLRPSYLRLVVDNTVRP